jgi:ubiquinone/menaquinone biosynthesis C-methylase UbiE
MPDLSDPRYVAGQYQTAANLEARIGLHERFSTNPQGWHRWVFDQFALPATARILELGCGPGRLWAENADRIPPGWALTLTDRSPGMVAEARAHLAGLPCPVTFAVADAQALPFPETTFDAVIANHMLYHVPDRVRAYTAIKRVLKRSGRFYAATIGRQHMAELRALVQRFDPAYDLGTRLTFTLESGSRELTPWFLGVQRRDYEDSLLVTESDPLVAYVASGRGLQAVALDALRRHVEAEIAAGRPIQITKASGLFVALR